MGIIFLSLMVLNQLVPFLKSSLSERFTYRASSKMEKLNAYSVCLLVFVAICAADVKETTQFKLQDSQKETVSITVQHTEVERGKDGKFKDEKSLKVNLQVNVHQGDVLVNNQKAKKNVVVAFHMRTEIITMGKDAKVIDRSKVPIIARILVLEEQTKAPQGKLTFTRLHVQAQIVEINKRKVEQFNIQEIVMELDNDKNEVLAKRTLVMLSLTEAEIHKRPRKTDHHVHCHRKGGRLPESPYKMSKDDMKPHLPHHPYHGDKKLSEHGHDRHHHKKSLCSRFLKLPFGARLAVFIAVAGVGLAIFLGCFHVFCLKKAKKSQKYDITQFKDSFDPELEDEAPPLEQKKPLDEQKLVISA